MGDDGELEGAFDNVGCMPVGDADGTDDGKNATDGDNSTDGETSGGSYASYSIAMVVGASLINALLF